MSTAEEEMRTIAIQYAAGAVVPMVVKAAIELDLFQLIHVSAAELAALLPTTNPGAAGMLERILRLLNYEAGGMLSLIISINPSIKGINYDLPHVIQNAPSYPEHVGGDMFVSVPKGDAILMKNVLHNWGDTECVKILRNCKEALTKKGKVVIIESVLSEIPRSGVDALEELTNLLMSSYNPGGNERTEMEFRILGKQAGFQGFRKVCYVSGSWFMEFYTSSAQFPI